MATLKDADISIRRRGLDLLFTMCNNQNVRDIVDELLKYLEIADFSMRDELVLKTAVLAERSVQCSVRHLKAFPMHLAFGLLMILCTCCLSTQAVLSVTDCVFYTCCHCALTCFVASRLHKLLCT